jgi:nicotinate-nucleotide adenylyltransferase
MMGAMRIGVFGGAFDPPHAAHRALVQAALEQLQLDQLRVVPTGQAWHKARPLSDAVHRLAMARLAFAGQPRVLVDAREIDRTGPSYTVDTLRELQTEHPGAEFVLIIGQDQAAALASWHAWREVLGLATICVAARRDPTGATRPFTPPSDIPAQWRQLDFPEVPISATDIRARVAAGQDVAPLVGAAVARYIAIHHLYQTT